MNKIILITGIFFVLAQSYAVADCSTFRLECSPCTLDQRYKVSIGCKNQNEDIAAIVRNSGGSYISNNLTVYPMLPTDPDAKYTSYKGPTGSFLELRIYQSAFNIPNDKCNSTLTQLNQNATPRIIGATDLTYLSCRVLSW